MRAMPWPTGDVMSMFVGVARVTPENPCRPGVLGVPDRDAAGQLEPAGRRGSGFGQRRAGAEDWLPLRRRARDRTTEGSAPEALDGVGERFVVGAFLLGIAPDALRLGALAQRPQHFAQMGGDLGVGPPGVTRAAGRRANP